MNRVAEHVCNDCQTYFPANRMKRHTFTTSTTSRSTRRDAQGNRTGSGETIHEHRHMVWLCYSCAEERRRAAVRNFFALLLLILFAGGGFYVYALLHPKVSQPANLMNEVGGSETPTPPELPVAQDQGSQVPSQSAETSPVEQPAAPAGIPSSTEPTAAAAPPALIAQTPPDFATVAGAQSASLKAFQSGRPERWKDGELKGWAVPSNDVVAGCRTVTFTVDTDPNHPSSPQKVCG